MAEMVFYGLVAVGVLFFVYIMITPTNSTKKTSNPPGYPPKGYTTDYLLMMSDELAGVNKVEINYRKRNGYYWIKCDENLCITDREHWGKPKPYNEIK